ncbi:MAG: hypothetical protein ABWY51_05340 [Gaiellaceae bacterium]
MRSFILIGLIGALLASTSIAQAHNTRWAWTESKAAKMVTRDATVKLAVGERASLTAELNDAVRLYGALVFAAQQVGDGSAMATFQGVLARYVSARHQVRSGVEIDAAACKGSGAALQGNRFKHFRCSVTSVVLEIPQTALDYGDQELPAVIEGSPRIIGPLAASLDVHVAGKASIAYREVVR